MLPNAKNLIAIIILFAMTNCKKDNFDVLIHYQSESLEVGNKVIFKYLGNPADSINWSFEPYVPTVYNNISSTNKTNKEIVAIFNEPRNYNVILTVIANKQVKNYSKQIKILPNTELIATILNTNNQIIDEGGIVSIYTTEKDASLLQNTVQNTEGNSNNGFIFSHLKPIKYYLRVHYICGLQKEDKIFSTSSELIPNVKNEIELKINANYGKAKLINTHGDEKVNIFICRSKSCSVSADLKPDYIIEPASSITISVPIGILNYFYKFERFSGGGGTGTFQVKCNELVEKEIGIN